MEAYCPLVGNPKLKGGILVSVAKKHGVSTSKILIRYCPQKGWVPLPKSRNPGRIKANADVFEFDLGEEDVVALKCLGQGPAGAIV